MNSSSVPSPRARLRGFTLIEMIVTMCVGATLAAIAVPAFGTFLQNDRDITQANSLVTSLSYARSEAIKQDVTGGITVCPSADGATCGGAWTNGWIVVPAAGGNPMQATPAPSGNNNLVASPAAGVTFLSSGLVSAPLTVIICDTRGASYARDVEVNAVGRIASSQTPGKSVSGAALVCP
jgi:type IV fimbrial biogenesis protein FimT